MGKEGNSLQLEKLYSKLNEFQFLCVIHPELLEFACDVDILHWQEPCNEFGAASNMLTQGNAYAISGL